MKTEFSSNSSSRLVQIDFGLISNCVFLFRCFFSAAGNHYWNYVLTNFFRFFQFQNVQAFFLASGNFFIKFFITTSLYKFWVKLKPCAFIQMFFFCCWKVLLKLDVNQFSSIFSVTNSGNSFSGSGNEVFIKSCIRTSSYRFSVNFKPCAFIHFFLLLDSIIKIRC